MAKAPKKTGGPKKQNLGPKIKKQAKEAKKLADEMPGATKSADPVDLGVDPDKRALFLSDLRKWQALDKAAKSASAKRRQHEKIIKSDGFLLEQIKLGDKLETPEGETEFKMKTANLMIAAQYVGAAIGQQLALFLEPDRTPAVDRAYDEGVQASMDGKTAHPPYDPSTPQHAKFMEGFHTETERRIKAGIKKTVEEDAPADRMSTIHAARAANVPSPDKLN